eukprot:6482467-Amphidinium_carterae.1
MKLVFWRRVEREGFLASILQIFPIVNARSKMSNIVVQLSGSCTRERLGLLDLAAETRPNKIRKPLNRGPNTVIVFQCTSLLERILLDVVSDQVEALTLAYPCPASEATPLNLSCYASTPGSDAHASGQGALTTWRKRGRFAHCHAHTRETNNFKHS